jgi:hypothetical protein
MAALVLKGILFQHAGFENQRQRFFDFILTRQQEFSFQYIV